MTQENNRTDAVRNPPQECCLVRGVGKHREKLTSFELALRDAGIAMFNLVRVSSIFPPGCKVIPRNDGLAKLKPGQITHVVLAEIATNEPHRLVVASIGLSIPADRGTYGYISEHHAFGETEEKAGEYAEDLSAEMLATILNVTDFDPSKSYEDLRQEWKISGKIYKTTNITQSALGDKNGLWTTVVAAVVFCG
jgi:arginine decarboxylase